MVHEEEFTVMGILDPTGTPNDRAVFVNMEGFYLIPEHRTDLDLAPSQEEAAESTNRRHSTSARSRPSWCSRPASGGAAARVDGPAADESGQREHVAQAVLPIREMSTLFATFVDPLRMILLGLTVMIVIVSGIGILVSIYNSMSERQHEIAVMRALGAGRQTVMLLVLLESILLSLAGGLAGWVVGHVLDRAALSPWIAAQTGVSHGRLPVCRL